MLLLTLLLLRVLLREHVAQGQGQGAAWCIARSGANQTALQTALDYACGSGTADCAPIQSSSLCYLPNTLQAHASYAFNSYYQRSNAAPGACDFGGTAVVTVTDPSYGSCTYPASASAAGSSQTPPTPSTPPGTIPSTTPPFGGTGGSNGFGPSDYSSAIVTPSHPSLLSLLVLGAFLSFQLMLI